MPTWSYIGIGFIMGLILFLAMYRYGPAGIDGLRWMYVSYGLGAAFIASPAFVMLLLRNVD